MESFIDDILLLFCYSFAILISRNVEYEIMPGAFTRRTGGNGKREGIAWRKGGSVCGSIPTAAGKSDFGDMYMKGDDTCVRGGEATEHMGHGVFG